MAINFEAANMAGYNNPRIEVFKAVTTDNGTSLLSYPDKAAILAAINRGSIPFLLVTSNANTLLLPLTSFRTSGDTYIITFGCTLPMTTNSFAIFGVEYPDGNSNPSFNMMLIQKETP